MEFTIEPDVSGAMAGANGSTAVVQEARINPLVASIPMAKTMALTDLANSLKEEGKDIVALAAGEPDFDTPEPIIEAGIAALRSANNALIETGTAFMLSIPFSSQDSAGQLQQRQLRFVSLGMVLWDPKLLGFGEILLPFGSSHSGVWFMPEGRS